MSSQERTGPIQGWEDGVASGTSQPFNSATVPFAEGFPLFPDGANVLRLTVPPSLDRLADLRAFLDSMELGRLLPSERVFDLKVAVSEAVANAIEHAGAPANVSVCKLPDRVIVDVGNDGRFQSARKQQPDLVRGFGLRLMVSLADEVAFHGSRQGRTNVRLTFVCGEGSGANVGSDRPKSDGRGLQQNPDAGHQPA